VSLPLSGTVFVSMNDRDKVPVVPVVRDLLDLGFYCGNGGYLPHPPGAWLRCRLVLKLHEGRPTSWMRLKPEGATDHYYTLQKKPRRMVVNSAACFGLQNPDDYHDCWCQSHRRCHPLFASDFGCESHPRLHQKVGKVLLLSHARQRALLLTSRECPWNLHLAVPVPHKSYGTNATCSCCPLHLKRRSLRVFPRSTRSLSLNQAYLGSQQKTDKTGDDNHGYHSCVRKYAENQC